MRRGVRADPAAIKGAGQQDSGQGGKEHADLERSHVFTQEEVERGEAGGLEQQGRGAKGEGADRAR